MAEIAGLSPALQRLIDKGLFDRLPPTFSTFFFEQIRDWDLLFPAERSYHERLFSLLDRSDAALVDRLFAPLRRAEEVMGVNEKTWPRGRFTLEQVDFLNRSPHYPEFRKAVSDIFSRLDPLLEEEIAHSGHQRLVVVIAPAEVPVGPDRMWLRIRQHGKRIILEPPDDVSDYLPLLMTGAKRKDMAPSIASRYAHAQAGEQYAAWVVEAGSLLSDLPANPEALVTLSYDRLRDYRARLMTEVHHIVEKQEVRGPRQLSAKLKELKIRASEGNLGRDAILAEFARAVLLSGNGTLLINNTFVEWSTIQAARRARPSVTLASFGIRNKIKPFTGLLIYADQETSNPIPTQMDTLGTYVDLEIFYQYIWQEFEKYAEYRRNTAYLFVGEGMDELFVIAPPDFPLLAAKTPVKLDHVFGSMKDWINL
jgi:hypothetical protein